MPADIHYPLGRDRRLFWLDGFLTGSECTRVLQLLTRAVWDRSALNGPDRTMSAARAPLRVSTSAFEPAFPLALQRRLVAIDQRLDRLVPHLSARREQWQATRYRQGGRFDPHFDFGKWSDTPAGDRKHTVLIYLDSPQRGGRTTFPELAVQVQPVAGRLVVWRNLTRRNEPDLEMLHASEPLDAGRKTVLITWVRQRVPR